MKNLWLYDKCNGKEMKKMHKLVDGGDFGPEKKGPKGQ